MMFRSWWSNCNEEIDLKFDHPEPGISVVTFEEERIDAVNSLPMKEQLSSLIETGKSQLVLDLGSVRFIDSSGLGMLVTLLKRAGMRGGVMVCQLQAPVAATFKLARMDRVFPIFPDPGAALASLR
jgi:anti-sigma B factor antagonist